MSNTLNEIRKQIDSYVKGLLNEEEIMDLWAEFARNPDLLDELELEVGVRKLVMEGFEESASEKPRITSLPIWTWHAAAAAVLVLIAFIQLFRVNTRTEIGQFVMTSIPADQLETSDGIRSKDLIITPADSLINLGFSAEISGNTTQSLSLYEQVIADHDQEPYGSRAYLNRGIIQYNQGEFSAASASFDSALVRVTQAPMVEEKAYWFKANALVQLNELEEARSAAYEVYLMDGLFRKQSFSLLQKINYDLGGTETNTPEEPGE